MKYLKEDLDYKFLDENDLYPTTPVEILTGVYKGIRICYGKVQIIQTEENGDGILSFGYQIISPEELKEQLNSDEDFKNFLGNLLDSIILDTAEADTLEEVEVENREDSLE